MEKAERVDVREGDAESLWPPELVKACLYSVRKKNVNMSLFIRAPFHPEGRESDVSIPPFS